LMRPTARRWQSMQSLAIAIAAIEQLRVHD
jgi:hypothetical protein